jgi:Domain of Unknown Function (DUF1080)
MLILALGATLAACGDSPPGARAGAPDATADGAVGATPDGSVPGSDAGDTSSVADASPGEGGVSGGDGADPDAGLAWRSLFDGTSLAGWDRYLGKPSATEAPLGLDNDPRGVYSIATVDGAPAIRITGEIWGALISKETFCDFHLRAQYKWGTQIWPPLNFRDGGLMYLSTGPLGAVNAGGPALSNPIGSGAFMVSIEYQISPTDVGAMPALGPITFTTLGRTVPTERTGDWNHIDIVVQSGVATHALEGVEVARGQGFVLDWPGQTPTALACGKLQLQSEGAEIFFRAIEIQAPP